MFIDFLRKNIFLRRVFYWLGKQRAKDIFNKISPFLSQGDKLLDIGAGNCVVCEFLRERKFDIVPIDIKNISFVKGIEPIIYNGEKIPFDDKSFDKSLILTVLHHTPEPEEILLEAKRVSKKIIVIEDVYNNKFHKYLTYFFDSLINWEFVGHPHSNKSDAEWRFLFKKMGLNLLDVSYGYSFVVFKHATYYLEV
jgi:SAM-dependent methyltransferase